MRPLSDYVKVLLLIIFLFVLYTLVAPDQIDKNKLIKYYIHDSEPGLDPNFKLYTSIILEKSGWHADHNIQETQNVNEADIQISLKSAEWVDQSYKAPAKYYPNGKKIKFSYTTIPGAFGRPKIYINADNWKGVPESGLDRHQYRVYVIEHEFGHALGYDHQKCDDSTAENGVCPVMYQSTVGCPDGFKCGYAPNRADRRILIKNRSRFR